MKTMKKIISVLLAVMLVIGSVAVAANAEMLTEKAGTVLTYTATVKGKTPNAEGKIEVAPGEKITVEVYTQANYYLGSVGSELFAWSTGFFGSLTTADWHLHNHTNNYTPNQKYPVTGTQLGSNYKSGYEGFLYGRAYNPNFTTPTDASTPVLSYSFDLTVLETLVEGTTAKFVMPEQMLGLSTVNARFRQIYASVASNANDYGSIADAAENPETINVSGAVINFVVKAATTPIDYTELDAQMKRFDDADMNLYTPASWATASDAYNFAYATKLDAEATQDDVNAAAASLKDALDKLALIEYCSYAVLQQAINNCSELDSAEEYYDSADLATWKAALKSAQDLLAADKLVLTDENQATINNAAKALTDAYDALVEQYVDTAALAAAINAYKAPAMAPEYYDSAKYSAWQNALTAAQNGLVTYDGKADTAENRAAVAGLAADLEAKFNALTVNYVDTTALAQAVAACGTTEYAAEYYDADLYAAYTAALAAAQKGLTDYAQAADTVANQAAVADLAGKLTNAYGALVVKFVDVTALENAVTNCATPAYAAEYYDSAKYAAWTAALENAQQGIIDYTGKADTEANRAAVAALASDLETAYGKLEPQFVDLTDLNNAIRDCHNTYLDAEWYDATEYAAWQEARYAASIGTTTYDGAPDTEANRAAVAKLAADLRTAFEALDVRSVDDSALVAALALTPEYGAEYYDVAAYAAWQNAVNEGNVVYEDIKDGAPDTAENRKAIADAASAIEAAFDKLVPAFIDYSALESAVAAYGTTPEAADEYTEETYNPYAAALARAKDMLANKNTNAPASDAVLAAQIEAAAAELKSTFEALEIDTYVAIITNVTCAQEYFKVGDTVKFNYLCSVTGVTKIQLVLESGATLTYHRTHDAVSIKDNGDGTETWTIATKVYGEDSKVLAKAKLGKVWEEKGYKYNVVVKDGEDYSVKSAEVLLNGEAVTEFMTTDSVVLKIVAGSSTLRIRLVDQVSGATSTYTRTKATQEDNGNWVWLIERKAGAGSYAYDIYTTGSTNKLTDEGTDLTYTVKAPVVVSGPSTGETKDVVISATVEKARVISGNNATVTVVTDKNAKGVRVVDQYGAVQGYNKDTASATVDGDTLVWTITYKCITAGSYNCKVDALYGNQWMNNGATIAYKVAY